MVIKVLNIITGGLGREGISTTQVEFMRAMDKSDMQIDIAAVHNDDPEVIKEFENSGCRVIKYPDRKRNLVAYVIRLYQSIRKERYDIIHVHGSSALMSIELVIAKLIGVKVRIAHSRNTRADHEKIEKLFRPLFNISYNTAFACGDDAGKWLFGGKDFYIIHNGKDLEKFKYSNEKRLYIQKQLNISNRMAIGFVGNLNAQKNLPFLMSIIKDVINKKPDTVFYLIGDGPERAQVEETIKSSNLQKYVFLVGKISNICEMLQAMDLMLLPSLYEGLPNVVLEWQAAGLPALVSDTVTRECSVCELVNFLPIDKGRDCWVDNIISFQPGDRKKQSEEGCKMLAESNFEIFSNARYVKSLYIEKVEDKL